MCKAGFEEGIQNDHCIGDIWIISY